MQSEIDDVDSRHLAMTDKKEKAITHIITEIEQATRYLKKLLDTGDVNLLANTNVGTRKFFCAWVGLNNSICLPYQLKIPADLNTVNFVL